MYLACVSLKKEKKLNNTNVLTTTTTTTNAVMCLLISMIGRRWKTNKNKSTLIKTL